jgi:acetoin utilization deacetylase AcuC-like enzyme
VSFCIYHPEDINAHPSLPWHPERVHRLWASLDGVSRARIGPRIYRVGRSAGLETAELLHDEAYIQTLTTEFDTKHRSRRLDGGDTHQSRSSLNAALAGIGASCDAIDELIAGSISGAFVLSRPPGHHAGRSTAMGFCLLGTTALAAAYAVREYRIRVAVLDIDGHHGNGSEELLWHESDVLFASTHQSGAWPMTGSASSKGAHGQVLNIPLLCGAGSNEMRSAWSTIFNRVREFGADLIIVSAGFDAHADDPLLALNWSFDDYTWFGAELRSLADKLCSGRVLSVLEGGYDLSVLMGAIPAYLEGLHSRDETNAAVADTICIQGSPYIAPAYGCDGGGGFECVKAFSRLWIQSRQSGEFVYTPPDFLHLTDRKGLEELAVLATDKGRLDIIDLVEFEHGLRRRVGYRQRSSRDFSSDIKK